MKIVTPLKFILIGAICCTPIVWSGEFQNLSFEEPIMPFVPNDPFGFGRIPISQVMPGWTAYVGDHQMDLVSYNNRGLSVVTIALYDNPNISPGWPIIEGDYTVLLQSGIDGFISGTDVSASVAQVGYVSFDIRSVQMKIRAISPFTVSMGGQAIEMVILDQQPTYTLYGGDVSAFVGQETELRITSDLYFSPTIGGFGRMFLDDIQFSTMVVPEPSTWMLLGLGALALGWKRWRGRAGPP